MFYMLLLYTHIRDIKLCLLPLYAGMAFTIEKRQFFFSSRPSVDCKVPDKRHCAFLLLNILSICYTTSQCHFYYSTRVFPFCLWTFNIVYSDITCQLFADEVLRSSDVHNMKLYDIPNNLKVIALLQKHSLTTILIWFRKLNSRYLWMSIL